MWAHAACRREDIQAKELQLERATAEGDKDKAALYLALWRVRLAQQTQLLRSAAGERAPQATAQ